MHWAVRALFGVVGLFIAGAAYVVDSSTAARKGCSNATDVPPEPICYANAGTVPVLGFFAAVCFLVAFFCPGNSPRRSGHNLGDA